MMTASVMVGSALVGRIVCTPVPARLNVIVLTPTTLLESMICCRNEPVPESLVLVTIKFVTVRFNVSVRVSTPPLAVPPLSWTVHWNASGPPTTLAAVWNCMPCSSVNV